MDRSQIISSTGTPRCQPNQYLEKNTSNLQKLCYHTNKSTDKRHFPLDNEIIFLRKMSLAKQKKLLIIKKLTIQ